MTFRFLRWCKHPIGLGFLLIIFGSIIFYLPFGLGLAGLNHLDLDYGDFVSIGAFVSTIVIAVFSIIPNLQSMAETSRSAHYSELDAIYIQILSMALDRPFLRQPDDLNAFEADQKHQYDTYAFLVWNFLETIHDRCEASMDLRGTWAPVIAAEHELHKAWFRRETTPYDTIRAPKFCLPFCDFIWRSFWGDRPEGGGQTAANRQAWIDGDWGYRKENVIRNDPEVQRMLRAD